MILKQIIGVGVGVGVAVGVGVRVRVGVVDEHLVYTGHEAAHLVRVRVRVRFRVRVRVRPPLSAGRRRSVAAGRPP